jgi:hypothetical protein
MDMGTFVGVLGILIGTGLAYYFYRKTIRTKVLSISYSQPQILFAAIPAVKATFRSESIDALSATYLLLWNTGSSPIENSDFVSPVILKNTNNLVDLDILDKDVAASATIMTGNSIRIDILRPNEAIIFRILAREDAYKLDISVVMKSADMSSFLRLNRTAIHQPIAVIISLALGFALAWYIDHYNLIPTTTFWDRTIYAGASVLVLVLVTIVGLVLAILLKLIIRRTTPLVVWRFMRMQRMAREFGLRIQLERMTDII